MLHVWKKIIDRFVYEFFVQHYYLIKIRWRHRLFLSIGYLALLTLIFEFYRKIVQCFLKHNDENDNKQPQVINSRAFIVPIDFRINNRTKGEF